MKVDFTNLIKASEYSDKKFKKKIIMGMMKLISNNEFVGGMEVCKFENEFSKYTKVKNCISVGNGTDALEIALEALSLPKNSEVILPVNTWISTAEAISRSGLKLVFCDINLHDYGINLDDLKNKISKKTSAIIVVHLFGYPSDMIGVKKIVNGKNIRIIEDCAQAHGTKIKNKHVGTFGDISTFSFFPGKNLGAFGDAGAIITNNKFLAQKCKRIRNHGALKKYDHELIGRNSRLDSLQCFVLRTKIKTLNSKIKKRNLLAKLYFKKLNDLNDLCLPNLSFKDHFNSFHQFVIRIEKRDALQKFLKHRGIGTMIHYPYMLNELKFFKKIKGIKTLKNSHMLGKKILSLPISEEHSEKEILYVCKMIRKFFNLLPSKH